MCRAKDARSVQEDLSRFQEGLLLDHRWNGPESESGLPRTWDLETREGRLPVRSGVTVGRMEGAKPGQDGKAFSSVPRSHLSVLSKGLSHCGTS